MVSRVQARCLAALSGVAGTVALGVLAACVPHGTTYIGHGPDCDVQVLLHAPGDPYIELGEMSFEAYAADPHAPHIKNPHVLAALARSQICALGGDTLVAEQNTEGVIVHATVWRHQRELEPAPPPPPPADRVPSRSEPCDPACDAGQVCEGGACVAAPQPACAEPPCGDTGS
jgi:hypothetical protein